MAQGERLSVQPAAKEEAARAPPIAERTTPSIARKVDTDPARSMLSRPIGVQTQRFVSSPNDAAEREADRVAAHVVSMPDPTPSAPTSIRSAISRSPMIAQRVPAAPASTRAQNDNAVAAEIKAAATGGFQLPKKTRALLEPRFRADFGGVRLHTDANAKRLSNKIGARAFTYGRHIFFNAGQYNPDSQEGLQLLAHELTHTIQQSETIQRKAEDAPRVEQRTGKKASRLGISDALDYFADAANAIPGYRMFTILIGVNPINMSSVEASAANILRAIVEFLPGGNIITRVLDSYGVFDKVGNWIEAQLKSLGITGSAIKAAIDEFLDSLGWRDIFRLGDVWNRAKRIFTTPITRIISFAKGLFVKILEFVQEAVLRPLAALAAQTPFYTLLKAVLGKDPVTGEAYEGGAAEVIGGFMMMIGQQELWQNIQNANAIPRAFAWFKTAMKGLMGLVTSIPTRFIDGLKSLEIMDFVVLPRAFAKIGAVLGSFLADFGSWALGTVLDLLKIIVEVVAPAVMPYIKKAAGAFNTILRNPIGFVRTLVRAAMLGFRQFATNFLKHLQASLVGWLTGAMAGANIYIPQGLNLREILKFVLSILGLTWANIRAKLVRATNETTVVALETGFDIVRTLVTEGPAAAWQKILEVIGNLKQMAIDAIMDFVKSRVVEAAVTRLLSMLTPAGAFIQAIIAIYNTIMFFVERLRQIAQVAASFIDAIATIASGNVGPAANRVESTMAGLLTLVISFLARIAGLGRVADAVTNLINRIRAPIDRALDAVVNWIVTQARRLGAAVMRGARGAVAAVAGWWRERTQFRNTAGETHSLYFNGEGDRAQFMMASTPQTVRAFLDGYPNKTAPDYRTAVTVFDRESRIIYTPQARGADENQRRRDVSASIARIGAAFSRLAGPLPIASDYPTTTAPNYSDYSIQYIVGSAPGGTTPGTGRDTGTPGWAQVYDAGLTRATDRWVQMHVISERLGGQGVPANLVPAPNSVNSGPFRSFEHQVLNLARGRDSASGISNVVWFKAAVSKNGVYARSISAQAGVYFWNGTNKTWIKNDSYTLHARAAIPAPPIDATTGAPPAVTRYSLNYSSGTELRAIGISAPLVAIIRQNRMYPSIAVFKTRVKAQANAAGIANANNAVDAVAADPRIVLNGP